MKQIRLAIKIVTTLARDRILNSGQLIADIMAAFARCGILLILYWYVFQIKGQSINSPGYVFIAWSIFMYFALSTLRLRDISKMIMAGASAVQIYSAVHIAGKNGVSFVNNFNNDLKKWMDRNGYKNIDFLRGILLPKLLRDNQMKIIIPKYDESLCIKCKNCVDICLEKAVEFSKNKIKINKNKCVGCGACASVCPTKALK